MFVNRLLVSGWIFLIQLYRRCISPALGERCRFFPSCSQYSVDAFKKYGAARGMAKTCIRLCKCHPWHPGGVDLP